MSKDEILVKVRSIIKRMENFIDDQSSHFKNILEKCLFDMENASMEVSQGQDYERSLPLTITNRFELKAKLLEAAKTQKVVSPFSQKLSETIKIFENFISQNLLPLTKAPPLIELFVFADHLTIKQHIMGVPRAAVHQALNNPAYYLQCECCENENDDTQLLPSMPDVSIVYKLHLECGKMINMFDWLQSFKTVVDDDTLEEEDDDMTVDPKIQARFTRAVAELQFLGFIKPTNKKTDHVQRLTW